MTSMKRLRVTTDDTEYEDIQQPKKSFNRFGDDLCGLILSYLSLDERFDCECVSKQFQRTVFESVVDITLNESMKSRTNSNDMKMLATIARKCSHIHTIDIRRINYTMELPEVLAIFRDNCLHLRNIYCYLDSNTAQIMPEFGPMVTRIGRIWFGDRQPLTHCHRLSRLRASLSGVFDDTFGELLAKNLQRIEFYDSISNDNQRLSAFVAKNQSLRSVKLFDLSYQTHESLTEMAEQLSRLPQLRDLELNLRPMSGHNSLDKSLRTIGQKCRQLKRLTLVLNYNNSRLEDQSLDSLRSYPRLKRLDLSIFIDIDDVFLDPLKLCHQLTHLSLNSSQINDNLFVNCDKHWPRLQCLSIQRTDITSNGFDHISRLPALQTLVVKFKRLFGKEITDNVCEELLTRSAKLKTIEIHRNTDEKFYCRKNGLYFHFEYN